MYKLVCSKWHSVFLALIRTCEAPGKERLKDGQSWGEGESGGSENEFQPEFPSKEVGFQYESKFLPQEGDSFRPSHRGADRAEESRSKDGTDFWLQIEKEALFGYK